MPPLTLTILGSGPAAPNPGGANSGYLVRYADTAVVLDCGPGTAGQVALYLLPRDLSAIAISHFHPDHYFDLVALYYLIKFDPAHARRVPLWVPPGGRAFLDRFGQLTADKPALLEDVFDLREYPLKSPLPIGSLEFEFHPVQHYVPSYAMRVRSPAGTVLTFSSDVAPCPALPEVARDADLFMCESAFFHGWQDASDPTKRGHMSALEAGQAATQSGAKRLLITHYRSSPDDDAHHLGEARKTYKGPVELARPGVTYTAGG